MAIRSVWLDKVALNETGLRTVWTNEGAFQETASGQTVLATATLAGVGTFLASERILRVTSASFAVGASFSADGSVVLPYDLMPQILT